MNTILEVKKLNKSYPLSKTETQQILYDVDLSVEQGEFVAVMGASGSGKSTLLYNISGMDRPDSGTVTLMEQPLHSLGENELASLRLGSIGYVFQQSNLLKNLNIFDNIILPAYKAKKEERQSIDSRADRLMRDLGISELVEKDITQASGGQLQRVAICRAIINKPTILFGDEPTGALNSKATEEVMDILEEINKKGTTVLLVTHDVRVAARASRVLYMMDGRIVNEIYLDNAIPNKANWNRRETTLIEWLKAQGF